MIHVASLKIDSKRFQDKKPSSYYCGKILVSGGLRPRIGVAASDEPPAAGWPAASQRALLTERRPHMADRLGWVGGGRERDCGPQMGTP